MIKRDYRSITSYFKTPPDIFRYRIKEEIILSIESGKSNKDIADEFAMHPSVVSKYWKQYTKAGFDALKSKKRGRKQGEQKKLSIIDERSIIKIMIDMQPKNFKEIGFWTIESVRDMINSELNIDMSISTVANYLREWRLTYKLYEVSTEAYSLNVANWFIEVWPNIKEKAKHEKAEIIRIDGVHRIKLPDTLMKRSKEYSAWKIKCYQMKIIAPYGKKSFILFSKRLNVKYLIEFYENLIQNSNKKVYLIWNMKKVYPMKPVKEWLEKNHDRIVVYYVPQ